MADLPPLDALRVFDAAARLSSFAKAAAALHLTPSAVSHRMKALEAHLGTALFERRVRAVRLTAAGRLYAAAVAEALEGLREATRRMRAQQRNRPLTVSTSPLFALRWLLPRLPRFEASNPGLVVHLVSTSALASFAEDGIDLAVRSGRGGWTGMVEHRLMPMNLTPVCAPALCRGRQPLKRPADLVHHTILHSDQWPQAWRAWLAAVSVPGVDPAGGRHFQDTPMAVDAALAGMGVAIVPRRFVQAELAEGKLVAPFGREIRSGMAYYLLYPQARAEEPRVVLFRDWLLQEFASERPKRQRVARADA